MPNTASARAQAKFMRARPNASRFYRLVDGRVLLLPDFKRRNLDPEWAAFLRQIRALGIGLPEIVTVRGKFIDDQVVGALGMLGD